MATRGATGRIGKCSPIVGLLGRGMTWLAAFLDFPEGRWCAYPIAIAGPNVSQRGRAAGGK
jgi:hypothetical protein